MLEDCQSFSDKKDKQIFEETKRNISALYRELFDLKRQQRNALGEDGEILEYTKALFSVDLPEAKIVLPREKPIPKAKPQTKWEKFREERGLPPKSKRSRMIFDPVTNDWVPRWGHNSKKKIAEKHDWLLEDKPDQGDVDPFTRKRQEKKLVLEKEKLKQIKNEMHAQKVLKGKGLTGEGNGKILAKSGQAGPSAEEIQKAAVKKRERKALEKSFKLAQLSTASMGKFDKKISKKEPDAPDSQKILKKKSNAQLAALERDRKSEKDRNMKILSWMQKAQESKASSKADAHVDTDKLVGRQIKKEERRRKKANKSRD